MTDREHLIELVKEVPVSYELCMRMMGHCPTIEKPCYECFADYLFENGVTFAKDMDVPSKWIRVEDEKPADFVSVLGHMTDAGDFPAVRECYHTENGFYFPALREIHPIDKWAYMPGVDR